MVTIAVRRPSACGAKVTAKVVLPPTATAAAASADTVNSAASLPVMATFGVPVRFSAIVPVFATVKVRMTVPPAISALPKSV